MKDFYIIIWITNDIFVTYYLANQDRIDFISSNKETMFNKEIDLFLVFKYRTSFQFSLTLSSTY